MRAIEKEKGIVEVIPEDTLNKSIIAIRVNLQKSSIKKSGHNSFSKFDYYELSDFLPKLNELMLQEEVNDIFTIEDGFAKLILIKGDEKQEYKIPFTLFDTPLNWKKNNTTGEIEQVKSMQDIQYLGALNTYYKRYLYLNAFGITDGEIIDSMDNTNMTNKKVSKTIRKPDEEVNELLTKQFNDALIKSGLDLDKVLNHFKDENGNPITNYNLLTEKQRTEAIILMDKYTKKNMLDEAEEQIEEEQANE